MQIKMAVSFISHRSPPSVWSSSRLIQYPIIRLSVYIYIHIYRYYVLLRTVMWLRDSVGRVITSSGGQREIRRWLKKEEWPRVGETAQSNDMLIFIISYSFNVKLRSYITCVRTVYNISFRQFSLICLVHFEGR